MIRNSGTNRFDAYVNSLQGFKKKHYVVDKVLKIRQIRIKNLQLIVNFTIENKAHL